MVGNKPLRTSDTDRAQALERRVRLFQTVTVSDKRTPLIARGRDGEFSGPLLPEMPGIFNWVISMDPNKVKRIITDTRNCVSSFKTIYEENELSLNPIQGWIEEELIASPYLRTSLGFKQVGRSSTSTLVQGKFLYPTYVSYCERRNLKPMGHTNFSTKLLETCNELGIRAEKVRISAGMAIKGLGIHPKVTSIDHMLPNKSKIC